MLCLNCKTAADLTVAATDLFTRDYDDPWYGREGLDGEEGVFALAVAAAVVKLHAECGDRCPCQHRGTSVARRPAETPVALTSAPLGGAR
jgi:hypothetical protein